VASSGDALLAAGQTLVHGVPALLASAGIAPANATQAHFTIRRVGSSCAQTFGAGDTTLATVTLDFSNVCSPSGNDAFCITPIESPVLSASNITLLGLNTRGEVLIRIEAGYPCQSTYDTEVLQPCGAVWRNGVLRLLPDRFVPKGLADDGSVAGQQLSGVLSNNPALQTYSEKASVLPQGQTPAVVLGTNYSVMSVSPTGRVIYQVAGGTFSSDPGCIRGQGGSYYCPEIAYYASTGPAWGAGTLLRDDKLPVSLPSFSIYQDADAAGIVGAVTPYLSGTSYAMKDFVQGASGVVNLAADGHGTMLTKHFDAGLSLYLTGLVPESSYLPATWQPSSLGRNGDVLACAAADANGAQQVMLVNLYSGTVRATVPGTLTIMAAGTAYTAYLQWHCDTSQFPTPSWIDDKGRVLVNASSDSRPDVHAAILTPRGVALP
jgi:hypothetical protein